MIFGTNLVMDRLCISGVFSSWQFSKCDIMPLEKEGRSQHKSHNSIPKGLQMAKAGEKAQHNSPHPRESEKEIRGSHPSTTLHLIPAQDAAPAMGTDASSISTSAALTSPSSHAATRPSVTSKSASPSSTSSSSSSSSSIASEEAPTMLGVCAGLPQRHSLG